MRRPFLVPLSVAVAALSLSGSSAAVPVNVASRRDDEVVMLPLAVPVAEFQVIPAGHSSHSSHASHSSHFSSVGGGGGGGGGSVGGDPGGTTYPTDTPSSTTARPKPVHTPTVTVTKTI